VVEFRVFVAHPFFAGTGAISRENVSYVRSRAFSLFVELAASDNLVLKMERIHL
jgi:hypothetical protein